MYFCPNCSYLFDISKSSNTIKVVDTRIPINKVIDAITLFEEGTNLSNYKATFNKEEITKNKKFQKFKDIDRIKVMQIFEDLISSGADFICNNCEGVFYCIFIIFVDCINKI